jgi:ATP-dependent Clp protease ATP-binding subunit ClpC
MPGNQHRFSYFARQALDLAQGEAERLHHDVIDGEHLLVGIIRENHGIGSRVLHDLGVDAAHIRALVEELNPSKTSKSSNVPELSPVVIQVLDAALDEALQSGHSYINTEHLLLALVRQTDSVAMEVLKRLGVTTEAIRKRTYAIINPHFYIPPAPLFSLNLSKCFV